MPTEQIVLKLHATICSWLKRIYVLSLFFSQFLLLLSVLLNHESLYFLLLFEAETVVFITEFPKQDICACLFNQFQDWTWSFIFVWLFLLPPLEVIGIVCNFLIVCNYCVQFSVPFSFFFFSPQSTEFRIWF